MKTRIVLEDSQGWPRRYYAEVVLEPGVVVEVDGTSVADAARKVVDVLRRAADYAESRFIESGVLAASMSKPTVVDDVRDQAREVLARVRVDVPVFAGNLPISVQQALNLLAAVADGMERIDP